MSTYEKKPQAAPNVVDASDVTYDNSGSGLSSTDIQSAIDETYSSIGSISDPLLFKGSIALASDFPTSADVETGWFYVITADVTDNDATKTNTGQSFSENDEIVWNGTNWTLVGNVSTEIDPVVGAVNGIVKADGAGNISAAVDGTDYTNHSPVTVTDSSEIDFTLTGQEITASIKSGSIDETKLDTSVNASLDLADSALQDVVDDTTPQLGGQLDVNGKALGDGTNELVKFSETASAVNEITIKNNSTGNAPEIKATGDDTNIDLNLVPKGTGGVQIGGVNLKKTQSTSSASSITPTGNAYENESYVTALAANLTINAPSGTASNGNTLLIRIKDDGTSRTLTWNAIYTFIGTTKPTATTISKVLYIGAIYNSTSSKWEVTSINEEE